VDAFALCDREKAAIGKTSLPSITMRGSLVVFRNGESKKPPPIKEKGSCITEFSPAARLRLLKFTATIDFKSIGKSLFLTLTYPDSVDWSDYTVRQQHKQLFLRKLEDYLGKQVCGLWRTEWMVRESGECVGEIAPHFHLLLFNVRWVPWQSVRSWWASVIHHEGYVRTEIRRARGARACGHYVSKYVAKVPSDRSLVNDLNQGATGKHYGYVRPRSIPRASKQEITDPSPERIRFLWRYAIAAMPWAQIQCGESFTLLGRSAIAARRAMSDLGLDGLETLR
jgi:hypothetical protein